MKETINKLFFILQKEEKKKIPLLIILMFIGGILELLGVAGIFPIISSITEGTVTNNNNIVLMCVLLIVVYIIKNLFLTFMYKSIYSFVYCGRSRLATSLFDFYMNEPYSFHLYRNISVIQRAVRSDVDGVFNVVRALLQMTSELIICMILGILLFFTDVKMALYLVIILGFCMGMVLLISKKIVKRLGQEEMYNAVMLNQWLMQGISGIKETKLLSRESYFVNEFNKYSEASANCTKKQQLIAQLPRMMTESVCIIAVMLWIIIISVSGGNLLNTIPTLAVFAVAAFRLLPSIGKINGLLSEYHFYKSRVDFVYEDLNDVKNTLVISDTSQKMKEDNNNYTLKFEDIISVENVSFKYNNTEKFILDGVSLDIPVGSSIGIIGPSGAGKTTFVDVMMGLLEIESGDVKVDGRSIYENIASWYQLIGYVPQVIYLADDSIKKNIAFGLSDDEIDDQRIIEVIKEAQMTEFIEQLAEGVDTVVGDRGIRLSGGQRQRIGIARALYNKPEILILDEATSSLDNETETAVMNSIEALHGKVTMIVIAHRLSTIQSCDKVYRVENAKIVEVNE